MFTICSRWPRVKHFDSSGSGDLTGQEKAACGAGIRIAQTANNAGRKYEFAQSLQSVASPLHCQPMDPGLHL